MEKFKSIADLMNEIANKKNSTPKLPREHKALINQLTTEGGQLAAVALMVNKETSKEAKRTFLNTFEPIKMESVMMEISARNLVQ